MQIIHAVLLEPVGCLAEFPAREFDEIAARLFHETSVHSSGSEAFWRVLDLLETSGQSLDPSQQKLAEGLEVRAVDQVDIYEDVVPALSELKGMNIQMFLASSLSGAAVNRFLERFPVREFFSAIWDGVCPRLRRIWRGDDFVSVARTGRADRHLASNEKCLFGAARRFGVMMQSPSTAPLLVVDALEVAYHRIAVALHGVSLRVMPQTIVALLGNNGAGKTTTLRAISGFIGLDDARVVAGSIRFAGKQIENQPPHANTARGIVLVPERDKVFPNLTVAENLTIASSRGNAAERRHLEALIFQFFPALAELRPRLAGLLSGGERQMLALGSAIVCNPQLLLVDELSLGLAPVVVEDLTRRLSSIRQELGITVLLVEQNARVALEIADYGYLLENGRVVLEGAAAELRGRREIQEAYLGQASGEERRSYRALRHAPAKEQPGG